MFQTASIKIRKTSNFSFAVLETFWFRIVFEQLIFYLSMRIGENKSGIKQMIETRRAFLAVWHLYGCNNVQLLSIRAKMFNKCSTKPTKYSRFFSLLVLSRRQSLPNGKSEREREREWETNINENELYFLYFFAWPLVSVTA